MKFEWLTKLLAPRSSRSGLWWCVYFTMMLGVFTDWFWALPLVLGAAVLMMFWSLGEWAQSGGSHRLTIEAEGADGA